MENEKIGGAHNYNRMCGNHKLLLNATAVFGSAAIPQLLSSATYAALATTERGAAPQQLATGLWWYRPTQDVKLLALTFLSDTGANNANAVYEIGLYPRLTPTMSAILGKRHKVTLTLGTLTNASQTVEPFTGTSLGGTKTLRHYDTAVWAYRDTGDAQVYDKGFDAADGTGTIYIDMTAFDSVGIALLSAMPTSSVRELVGLSEECA